MQLMFWAAALWSIDLCWAPAILAGAVILLAAAKAHRDKTLTRSRHFYFCAAAVILLGLVSSALHWWSFTLAWAFASLILWVAYGWLLRPLATCAAPQQANEPSAVGCSLDRWG